MKIGTYDIDLKSLALGALAAWIVCSVSGKSGDDVVLHDGGASSGHWYDFGNGMVNLDQVNLITTCVNFEYRTFKITDEGCEDAIELFAEGSSKDLSEDDRNYRFGKILAHIEFDDFTLNLESFEVHDKNDIRRAFRSWKQTLGEIKKAQR